MQTIISLMSCCPTHHPGPDILQASYSIFSIVSHHSRYTDSHCQYQLVHVLSPTLEPILSAQIGLARHSMAAAASAKSKLDSWVSGPCPLSNNMADIFISSQPSFPSFI
eukprot:GFUD01108925.1.p1 GENE.GFUD01108925.1~~GFUD01108925.1.p1  ORF type:complete len:109 (-),score=14.44 GFUD01108925.1:251-577(-)